MTGAGPRREGLAQLCTELAQPRRLVQERTADLQRVKAEYDNYRRRVRRDRQAVRDRGGQRAQGAAACAGRCRPGVHQRAADTRPEGHRRQPAGPARFARSCPGDHGSVRKARGCLSAQSHSLRS